MGLATVRKVWIPASQDDLLGVREELERILASPPFRNSRRYPSLLRYVVEKALTGDVLDLKERTLGIEVFHRPPDYDTNADPVVRFSAGEIRRRIAQFYQENDRTGSIEIRLPIGTYIPQFTRFDSRARHVSKAEDGIPVPINEPVAISHHQPAPLQTAPQEQDTESPFRPRFRATFLYGLLAGVLVTVAIAKIVDLLPSELFWHRAPTAIMGLWSPLVTDPGTVLISVGRTHFPDTDIPEPADATIEEHILRPEARISLSAVQAVSEVAGFLQTQHKQFRIREAASNTLQDLHRLPVVLVSGYNNTWTMRFLKPLRFHFEQDGSLHYIIDDEHPDGRDWSVAFDKPFAQQTEDYAIVARFKNATTDGPVVVIAGIGSNGSQAAGEFAVSPEALDALARSAPHGSLDQNFEAVLKVEVVSGHTGAATVVATQFW